MVSTCLSVAKLIGYAYFLIGVHLKACRLVFSFLFHGLAAIRQIDLADEVPHKLYLLSAVAAAPVWSMDNNLLHELIDDGGCQFFLLRFIFCGQFQKPFVADRAGNIVLIDTLENTVKLCDTLFYLGHILLLPANFFFHFVKPLLLYRFQEAAHIIEEPSGHIEYPLQYEFL